MRRLLLLPVVAATMLFAVPASAEPVVATCADGDYTVVTVVVGNIEIVEVCASESPQETIRKIIRISCESPCLPPK